MLNIKKKLDKAIPAVISQLGYLINPLILNFTNENSRLLVFYFHGLYESNAEKQLGHIDPQNNVTVAQFSEFIDYFLQHNYYFIKPEDLLKDLDKDQPYAMITFDDGYFNNILAVEILNKYKIPASFFITTKNVFENKSFWWDIIYKYRTKGGLNLETIRKEQAHLKNFKYSYIEKYIIENFGSKCAEPWSDIDRPFTCAELKNFSQNSFITIGNHTHNHSILTNYSEEEIKEDFTESNKLLLSLIGFKPRSIAFPNGNFNNSILNIARDAGFEFAFTTQNYINNLPIINNKMICLNRFMVKTSNIKYFGGCNRLGYTPDKLYSNLKKKMRFLKN
ncbi:MAG: polysaccharide deacetylase family protein [Bacteroidota bacterium]|nr:polysaccharide deacetylase family protein [Bacteroidota bacterium]